MSKLIFVYIDDSDDLYSYITSKNDGNEGIHIKFIKCEVDYTKITSIIDKESNTAHGFILDLELCQKYSGKSLAQYIREKYPLKPIIAFSSNENIKVFDEANRAFFDYVISKEQKPLLDEVDNLLKCLVNTYSILCTQEDIKYILKINSKDWVNIDYRIESIWNNKIKSQPIFMRANFILNDIVQITGELINEKILASRLGIDIEKRASNDWNILRKQLEEYEYRGVGSEFGERWWMCGITNWWESKIDNNYPLRYTSANQRVNLINQKIGTSFDPATPIEYSESNEFWTICKASHKPLDPIDGLLLAIQNCKYPWQDEEFISGLYAVHPEYEQTSKLGKYADIDPIDQTKLQHLQKRLNNERHIKKNDK